METSVACPYCGEENSIVVDESGGNEQQYVEDCQVCCKPWQVIVMIDGEGDVDVEVRAVGDV
jgi:transposase-like protein